ncbi:MAG: hypothetical protein HZA66_08395 [Rhodopseudomonas palustris]|uniref:Uncharacterized protein n=1 Tax=Rhodopseudomonas palustris TaxID=1076 RepID=A0A933RW34_RHOPL|nr:hypothetical protein [Rhodopseudomonas palustris]
MHPAKVFEFERLVKEFVAWRAVPCDERAPAAAWWWGPAMALRTETNPMPAEFCTTFDLPDGASYADAAQSLMAFLAPQTSQAPSTGFPRRPKRLQEDAAT